VRASFAGGGHLFDRDPNVFDDATSTRVGKVMMGDIVGTGDERVTLRIEAVTQAPIERIEVRNGLDVVRTLRPFDTSGLGDRIRVLWSGAEYRGRGRTTWWKGRVRFPDTRIREMRKINIWNHERTVARQSADTVRFDTITTGNFGGFDAWLAPGATGRLDLACNHGALEVALDDIGLDDVVMEAGGLERRVRAFRLPDDNQCRGMNELVELDLRPRGDNPIWVSVFTEDGFQAWSSPIFVFR